MTKEHAEHNESACDFLLESEKYNDWVVTTAFYSALHFVQHEIFPLTIGDDTWENFDDYFAYRLKNESRTINKHSVTDELVKVHFNVALTNYRFLSDSCWNARYKRYKVSIDLAKAARRRLAQLKEFLTN
ncbi:hypothetical protein [Dyadobacter pollutisoli]|jgi:hypothetical protein|uniref:HEPN domain-containing protein n=1 Tax=Dyadobacter pollutisoli TaxID=2910158 RepID=A0A9E8SKP1_9BACT|nr:hypothetical protein [Dyadobacter pollutisoli]WAC10936.1 hypothetical protein ON006_24715 [Dyadobacter pollutisoli]